jgi:hypothetical protein
MQAIKKVIHSPAYTDLRHWGIYGPSKQSVLVHLDSRVIRDVLFGNKKMKV